MDRTEEKLLEAFSCVIQNKKYTLSSENSEENLRFFHQAMNHMILPMIVESLDNPSSFPYYAKRARTETQTQARKSADFVLLYDRLLEKGLKPLVLKGIICRSLYPHPEERPSSDEDLWVDPQDFPLVHEALLEYGLALVNPEQNIEEDYEVAYEEKESLLYIEIHKEMFSSSSVYAYLNNFFAGARERAISEEIYRTDFYTLSHTDHLLYLILHAYKHFLYSGFGIRQVADIFLFSIAYRDDIDWNKLKDDLVQAKAYELTRAIYKIGIKYLINNKGLSDILEGWDIASAEEEPLLDDIMDSGIYGASSLGRLHTSTMTLNAMQKRGSTSILSSVFLPLSSMKGKYVYLKKYPYLLPYAWFERVMAYLKETKNDAHNDPQDSIRLGKERIKLLKKYQILDDNELN